jgi:hypothetical protein
MIGFVTIGYYAILHRNVIARFGRFSDAQSSAWPPLVAGRRRGAHSAGQS